MKGGNKDKTKKEFDELLLEVRRVTRVTTWWRRMSFRATVLVGNRKWKIWIWVAKGADVSIAVSKASREAYKNIYVVPLTKDNTVPYMTQTKYKACIVKLLPAKAGTGLKAWSSVRAILELAWYENILSKIIWSNNKLNNSLATIKALSSYKHKDFFVSILANKSVKVEESSKDSKTDSVEKVNVPKKEIIKKEIVEKADTSKKEIVKKDVVAKVDTSKKEIVKKDPKIENTTVKVKTEKKPVAKK